MESNAKKDINLSSGVESLDFYINAHIQPLFDLAYSLNGTEPLTTTNFDRVSVTNNENLTLNIAFAESIKTPGSPDHTVENINLSIFNQEHQYKPQYSAYLGMIRMNLKTMELEHVGYFITSDGYLYKDNTEAMQTEETTQLEYYLTEQLPLENYLIAVPEDEGTTLSAVLEQTFERLQPKNS